MPAGTEGKSKVLSGARAIVSIEAPDAVGFASPGVVALFSNCTWQIRQNKEPIFILGRYSPTEIAPTTQEAVSMTLTGYRVVDKGPYTLGVSKLQDLLKETDFVVTVKDRSTGKVIFKAKGCRILGWSSGVSSRSISDIRLEVMGLLGEDESGDQEEKDSPSL